MKKSIRNLVLGGLATLGSLGLNSCGEEEFPQQRDTTPPKISIYSPNESKEYSGSVELDYKVEDENFENAWYSLNGEGRVNLDEYGTKNLNLANGQYKLTLHAEDQFDNASKKDVYFNVNKSDVTKNEERSINLEAKLSNFTDINYDVGLKNIDEAEVNIYEEGNSNYRETEEINSSTSGTFSNREKGNHRIEVKSDTLLKDTTITVPNYNPDFETNDLNKSVGNGQQNGELNWNLESYLSNADKNHEDNPVAISEINSLDEKVEIIRDGYNVNIKPKKGATGTSQLEVKVGSEEGGFTTKTIDINIEEPEYQFIVNPFVQPNQENLNWYGSGDVNEDNVVDWSDYNSILGSNKDQADVDGDGSPGTSKDKQLLQQKLNGSIPYLPGEWDELQTREERVDWLNKMLAVDKTDEIEYSVLEGYVCSDFAAQTRLNFHGFSELGHDESKGLKDNGRFNIPTYYTTLGFHAINATLVGDDVTNFNDYYFTEPQNDTKVEIGDWNMPGDSRVRTNYTYVAESEYNGVHLDGFNISHFKLNGGVPELKSTNSNPDVKLIRTRQESDSLGN